MNSIKLIAPKLSLALVALLAFCGCQKQEKPAAPPAASGGGIVSAEKTSFDEVTAKLDKGGNLYLYLSTEQALSGLSAKLEGLSNVLSGLPGAGEDPTIGKIFDFANTVLNDSGIEQISGVGMSSIAREPGFYYSKLIIHHYSGQNNGVIWSVLGKAPHALEGLDMLPETTVLASFSDFDVPLIWQDVQEHVKKLNMPPATAALKEFTDNFHNLTGLDWDQVFASLGGNYGVILTLDPDKKVSLPLGSAAMEFPSPGLAIIAKVNSEVIFNRVDELAKNNPLVVRVDGPDLKMRTMTIPLPLPLDLRPSIARSGDYLLLASSDTLVHEILDVKAGKRKGFKTTAEFARLSQGIPTEGNNFSLVGGQFFKSMMALQQQALSNKGTMTQSQVDSFQKVFQKGTNGGNFTVGVNGTEGWEGFANGSQSLQSMILPAIAGVGAAAAIAVPNFIKAKQAAQKTTFTQPTPTPDPQTAQYNHIVRNLRLLQTAKQKWANEKGKAAGDPVTMEDLAPYLRNGTIEPVVDETYNPQPVGSAPTAKLAHDLHGKQAGSEITAPGARKRKPSV
jgi:hypothetical protein